jgi:Peptidase family M23
MRILWAVLALLFLPFSSGAVLTKEQAAMSLGQTYTANFYAGDTAPIWQHMTKQMREVLGNEDGLRRFANKVENDVGSEVAVIAERVETVDGYRTYTRQSKFSKFASPIIVSWSFDSEDQIAGFFVRPQQKPAPSPYLDYDTQAYLRLPFNGEWLVFWGGRTVEQNYHAAVRDQRFAYDLLVVVDGKSHTGDGKSNDQYYCWGKEILSPGSGTVVTAVSDLPDNPPGVMDPTNPPGNFVILDLGNKEFALLAHMQKGSVIVSEGDEVRPGQPIGLCGNSGNTSEPHLHFHLQDSKQFGKGDGKPVFFSTYLSGSKPVDRGEPIRGEVISPDRNAH